MGKDVSIKQVQKFILYKQGLRTQDPPESILKLIKNIHNVQIDTISVVARSQDLVLYNRLPDYKERDIWKLERDKKLFEYFSHRLCLIPIEEYPFYKWIIEYRQKNPGNWTKNWLKDNKNIVDNVYNYIKKNGETCSSDFKSNNKAIREGWWELKAENLALKHLFHSGKLLISYRKGFQRYYDLTERVIPSNTDTEPMDKNNLPDHILDLTISALGIVSSNEIFNYLGEIFPKIVWDGKKAMLNKYLSDRIKEGTIETINLESLKDQYYILKDEYDQLINQNSEHQEDLQVKFLTPFDNIIRDRYFPQNIWNFDYTLEAYVQKAKRKFGFFCLPILDNYDLVGFMDAKAYRKEKKLDLISIYINKETDANFPFRFAEGIKNFAQFHRCPEIDIGNVYPNKIKNSIISEIKM
ncbi:MAG: winged helix-turn-helix domain-containing protein [Promethearchaeota archaeon]